MNDLNSQRGHDNIVYSTLICRYSSEVPEDDGKTGLASVLDCGPTSVLAFEGPIFSSQNSHRGHDNMDINIDEPSSFDGYQM